MSFSKACSGASLSIVIAFTCLAPISHVLKLYVYQDYIFNYRLDPNHTRFAEASNILVTYLVISINYLCGVTGGVYGADSGKWDKHTNLLHFHLLPLPLPHLHPFPLLHLALLEMPAKLAKGALQGPWTAGGALQGHCRDTALQKGHYTAEGAMHCRSTFLLCHARQLVDTSCHESYPCWHVHQKFSLDAACSSLMSVARCRWHAWKLSLIHI